MKPWLRWAFVRITAVLIGIIAALVVAEIGLRILGVQYVHFDQPDYYLGWSLRPGASSTWTSEGFAHVSINSDGQRDREHQFAKPEGVLRVAVIGDSFAEAMQVEPAQAFWGVIERELAKCSACDGRQVETLNFGVNGYGTAQELLMLRRRVWRYSPDIVVLAFYPGNDVSDNMRGLPGARLRPYFYLQDGKLLLDNSFRDKPRFRHWLSPIDRLRSWLSNHLRVEQVINQVKYVLPWRRHSDKSPAATTAYQAGIGYRYLNAPKNDSEREGWDVTERLIETVNQDVRSHGATFLLVIVSDQLQVYPDAVMRAQLQKKYGIDDPFYPNRRLNNLARSDSFAVLDLGEPFLAYGESHHAFLHGFANTAMGWGHWNVLGHRLAGEMIASKLCAIITARRVAPHADSSSRPALRRGLY
jgi:hypothetical protein